MCKTENRAVSLFHSTETKGKIEADKLKDNMREIWRMTCNALEFFENTKFRNDDQFLLNSNEIHPRIAACIEVIGLTLSRKKCFSN